MYPYKHFFSDHLTKNHIIVIRFPTFSHKIDLFLIMCMCILFLPEPPFCAVPPILQGQVVV